MQETKKKLLEYCIAYADDRIRNAEIAIAAARDAASDDTKSSAGDKYETTREMMQQEISRNEKQLLEGKKLKLVLSPIDLQRQTADIQPGSLVSTNRGNFFISISAGQIIVDEIVYFAVSPSSPIGAALVRLKKGSTFNFNGKDYTILDIN